MPAWGSDLSTLIFKVNYVYKKRVYENKNKNKE